LLKSLYAAPHDVTEHGTHNPFEKSGTELKASVEMGKATGFVCLFKGPSNSKVKERSVAGADFNVFGSGENGLSDKIRMKPTHTHLLVDKHNITISLYDLCIMPTRQKFPIALHIGNKIEHLCRWKGKLSCLFINLHKTYTCGDQLFFGNVIVGGFLSWVFLITERRKDWSSLHIFNFVLNLFNAEFQIILLLAPESTAQTHFCQKKSRG
jgi:hypothetical protein